MISLFRLITDLVGELIYFLKKCHQGVVLEHFLFTLCIIDGRFFCLSVWENSFRFQGVVRSALPVTRIKVHLPYFFYDRVSWKEKKKKCFLAANKFRHQEASHKSFYIGLLSSRDVHEKKETTLFLSLPTRCQRDDP